MRDIRIIGGEGGAPDDGAPDTRIIVELLDTGYSVHPIIVTTRRMLSIQRLRGRNIALDN